MGDIINYMDSFAEADADLAEAAGRLREDQSEENLQEVLKSMGALAREALQNPRLKELMDEADESYKEFLNRYKDIIRSAPKFDAGLRMQYYAEVMLSFVHAVFHSDHIGFWDDFADFHPLFDAAYSDYAKRYKDLERPYPFTGRLTYDADELEKMVTSCLQDIVRLRPNESDEQKTKLMYKASELFEIYRNMLYYFDQ